MDRKFNILYLRKDIPCGKICKSTEAFKTFLDGLLSDESVKDIRVFEVVYFDVTTLIE